jgi:hypothetical protein
MAELVRKWSHRDLEFVVQTLVPGRDDPDRVVDLIQDDESLLDAMLQDDRLFEQLMNDDEVFVSVTPHFFFKVLLLRTQRDLEQELYTVERRHQQKVVLFDANRVVELLSEPTVREYLATMLASYTRINSMVIPIRVRQGIWYRFRVNDLDVDSLLRYAQILDPEYRSPTYQRIGDACLFLAGLFPEHIEARQWYPQSGQARPRLSSSLVHSLEDLEAYGRTFYHLAAEHPIAGQAELSEVLETLSERFILAEKPLAFMGQRYLSLRKHRLFEF